MTARRPKHTSTEERDENDTSKAEEKMCAMSGCRSGINLSFVFVCASVEKETNKAFKNNVCL